MSSFSGFVSLFWVSVVTYLLPLFRYFIETLFRMHRDNGHGKENLSYSAGVHEKISQIDMNSLAETKEKPIGGVKVHKIEISEKDESCSGEETPKLIFKFQSYEDFCRSKGRTGEIFSSTMAVSSSVEEFRANLKDGSNCIKENFCSEMDLIQPVVEVEAVQRGDCFCSEEKFWSKEDFIQPNLAAESVTNNIPESRFEEEKFENNSVKENVDMEFDLGSIVSSEEFSVWNHPLDSISDGFLSEREFELPEAEENHMQNLNSTEHKLEEDKSDRDIMAELQELENLHVKNWKFDDEVENFVHEDADILEEFDVLEKETHLHNSDFWSEDDFHGAKQGEVSGPGNDDDDDEDSQNLETLWEHQDLIEQLKMELRKVRATGLPTILEESESPKIMEDLQPWKIDEKFRQEDQTKVLPKFYKSYRERMRKFDILSYQKMYAIGVLQSKDPLQSTPSQKGSVPAMAAHIFQNLELNKCEKVEAEPVVKFIREMHSDLELVYVGQMCLSWEILHWQYEKALEIWESDPYGMRRYNEVAGEFQQFQVLLQRFVENEPFQGPRVQNYIQNRCIFCNLLQIPVIREDNLKDKKKAKREEGNNSLTSDMLVEIMEESIRIFWRFVRTDKYETNIILKGRRGTQPGLQDPADSELLAEVRTSLRKKEKKLKDLLRAGNCILKKFRKHQDDSSDQVLQFFSQVDLKLVSRVLHMSQITTEQLVWCRNKLNAISFVNKRIHVESSFLLFPCS